MHHGEIASRISALSYWDDRMQIARIEAQRKSGQASVGCSWCAARLSHCIALLLHERCEVLARYLSIASYRYFG